MTSSPPIPAFHEQWFAQPSCDVLAGLVDETKDVPGDVVEIGSWEGRSTVALANAAWPRIVHAVDTWAGSVGEVSEKLAARRDVYAQWLANVTHWTLGNVEPFRMDWRDYLADSSGMFSLVFIDALHTYEDVRDTIAAVLPRMSPGGIVCGDDVHDVGVHRAATEAFPHGVTAATLWIGRT